MIRMKKLVTRLLVALAIVSASLVVSQESTTGQQENNYPRVPCYFENNLCGWTNLNPRDQWTRRDDCRRKFLLWCTKRSEHYLQLQMDNLPENSTLSSPVLAARPNVRCQLVFLCYINCDADSCQLSVERQTDTGVTVLWNVTKCPANDEAAHVDVPCSDESYKILFVARKLASADDGFMNLDNIKFTLSTLPTTTEGITSLSRRVSLTFSSTLPATSPALMTSTSGEQSTEPMVQSDQQTGNDGLSTGSLAAIVVVAVLVAIVIVAVVLIVVRRRNAAEKNIRTPGLDNSASTVTARANNRRHDNLVYSVTGYELGTMERSRGNDGPVISPDYYNTMGLNSAESAAPTQDDLYENTGAHPQPQDEYAVPDKSGQKKLKQEYQKPEDEYAIPDKSGETKMKRANQKPEDEYAIPDKGQQRKQKQAGQDEQQKKGKRNRKKGKKRDETAAAGSTVYQNVGGNGTGRISSPSSSSHPEPPGDTYNELGAKERTGAQPGEPPLNHYDRISAVDDGYSGMNLEDKKRDEQREAVADQYSHI